MPRIGVGQVELFYQRSGPARPPSVILIMGWGGDHTAWALQVAALAEEFDVIAFDNRGAGQSDAPDVTYSMVDMAEDVTGLMDELGVRRAHVIGASMGGMVAQELALRHPDRVLSLQLHCTAAHVDEWGRAVIDNFLRAKGHGNVEEFTLFVLPWLLCRKTFTERRDFVEMWIQRALEYPFQTTLVGLNRQAQAIRGHDTRDGLATLRMPTLITTGTEDILVPPSASDDLHERIAGSELVRIPEAGHMHFLEQAPAFNETILRFLRKHLN